VEKLSSLSTFIKKNPPICAYNKEYPMKKETALKELGKKGGPEGKRRGVLVYTVLRTRKTRA